jgi:indolepyruvate ferredoxin oxidoreductase beta subunit
MPSKIDQFNIVIKGVGGQGLITLLQVIAEAAFLEGYDVKTSELHGLSQRGGSVEVHIRFGKKIYSPLVQYGKADFILGLEAQECLKAISFAGSQTVFLINKLFIPIPGKDIVTEEEITQKIKKVSDKIHIIEAADICKKELGNDVTSGIYLLSLAAQKGFIPLSPSVILEAIKKTVAPQYLDINVKTFELSQKYEK